MTVEIVKSADLAIINKLNLLQDFKLRDLNNIIIDRIVREDNKTIAYGIVKKMAEAIILVNPNVSLVSRAKALRELMKYAEFGARSQNCQQLHCFVKNERLAKALEKHFNFVRSEDIVLVKNL